MAEFSFFREIESGPPDEMEDGGLREREGGRDSEWTGKCLWFPRLPRSGAECRFKVSPSETWHVSFSSVQTPRARGRKWRVAAGWGVESVCKGGVGKRDLCIFAGGGKRGQEGSEGCDEMD